MRRALVVLALGAAALAAPLLASSPARACDPDEINALLTAVCEGALGEAARLAQALLPQAGPDAPLLQDALVRARFLCAEGDPVAGATEAARLSRLVGRIEARLDQAPPIWPRQHTALPHAALP
jgi:hypothetical protein